MRLSAIHRDGVERVQPNPESDPHKVASRRAPRPGISILPILPAHSSSHKKRLPKVPSLGRGRPTHHPGHLDQPLVWQRSKRAELLHTSLLTQVQQRPVVAQSAGGG